MAKQKYSRSKAEFNPMRLEHMKRNAILEEGKYVPLVRINPELSNVAHMIAPKDLPFLGDTVQYLANHGAEQIYLGGSAPENWLFKGAIKYGDLDLLVANPKGDGNPDFRKLLNHLASSNKRTVLRLSGSERTYVQNKTLQKVYMNFYDSDPMSLGPTYRFVRIPSMDELDTARTPTLQNSCPIDVTFFLNSRIETTMRELQEWPPHIRTTI